jgi:hypothetical protein
MREQIVYVLPNRVITSDYLEAARAWEIENRRRESSFRTAGEMPTATFSIAPTTTTNTASTI